MPRSASKGHSVSLSMTKKKPPSQRETLKPPTIPSNVMGRRDAWDSGFIARWLKNRKRGAPPRIAPQTTTNKKKWGWRPHHSCQWLLWSPQSPHTRQLPLSPPLSIMQALIGGHCPSIKVQTVAETFRGCFEKYLCSRNKSSTQTDYKQEQIQPLESWTLQISAVTFHKSKIERPWHTISSGGYHHYRGDYLRSC